MQTSIDPCKSALFPKSKEKQVSTRGLYQRYIVALLAFQISTMTRRAIARPFSIHFNLPQRSAYEHVSKELEECLVPDGVVEKVESVPSARGPRIYRIKGVACYSLTLLGILVATCLDEINMDDRKRLLANVLSSEISDFTMDRKAKKQLLSHLKKYPDFTLLLIKDGVLRYLKGQLHHPLEDIPKT